MAKDKNMELWNKVKQPPASALKTINAGRLKGKTDINPQWRYQALTEQFGQCGVGWKYEIAKLWSEPASDGQIFAFAQVNLYTAMRDSDTWCDPIPGIGGSMLVAKEKAGPHSSDEGYKMAVTDALSVACKMLGVAADIYLGLANESKYDKGQYVPTEKKAYKAVEKKQYDAPDLSGVSIDDGIFNVKLNYGQKPISKAQLVRLCAIGKENGVTVDDLKNKIGIEHMSEICWGIDYAFVCDKLIPHMGLEPKVKVEKKMSISNPGDPLGTGEGTEFAFGGNTTEELPDLPEEL